MPQIRTNQNLSALRKFKRNESGAVSDFLGLILTLFIIMGVLIPLMIELFIYNNQAQEMDRLTKLAAKRACALMTMPDQGIAGDLNEGSFAVGTDIHIMQSIVNSIFKNEASSPETYFSNTSDGENINLKVIDFNGNEIAIDGTNVITIEDSDGNEKEVILTGSNTDFGLCPSGGGADWNYCMNPDNDAAVVAAVNNTGGTVDKDLVARMEIFQPGRSGNANDFNGRIDRCSVCVTKTRESIFKRTALLSQVMFLDCSNGDNVTLLPCKMSSCATSRYVQVSAKRDYAPHFRSLGNLGQDFSVTEPSPDATPEDLTIDAKQDANTFCLMMSEKNPDSGVFENNLIGDGACDHFSM